MVKQPKTPKQIAIKVKSLKKQLKVLEAKGKKLAAVKKKKPVKKKADKRKSAKRRPAKKKKARKKKRR